MIRIFIHTGTRASIDEVPASSISEQIGRPDQVVWVDVIDPTDADFATLTTEFGFHPLAIEDASRKHQRAKLDSYDGYFYLAFYCLNDDVETGVITAAQVSIFSGSGYLVTIRDRATTLLEDLRDRLTNENMKVTSKTGGYLLYLILDELVDGYFPVIDRLSDRIESIEEQIFDDFKAGVQQDVFRLKKDLLAVRRALAPERDVMNILVRRENSFFDNETIFYFQDVYDHILRCTDTIDSFRDLLSGELDAYLAVVSNRMNQIMKTLTASSIILMGMTLVASVYGMNFDHMPELHWRLGYPYALGLMLAIGLSLGWAFRRRDWL